MSVVDIDFDIAGVSATGGGEETACTAADFGSDSGEVTAWEANVEQAGVADLLVSVISFYFGNVE